jgi:pimeloyl-ACP methyl ester carboxylesterase
MPTDDAECREERFVYRRTGQPEDYAYVRARRGEGATDWVVVLHGHGSNASQLFRREDIKTLWLPALDRMGTGILAPNLRGNAWMNPEAVEDLHHLLQCIRQEYGVQRFYLMGGSMGGTGALIYAVLHPEDVSAVWAGCPATDLETYLLWLEGKTGILGEIRETIRRVYGSFGNPLADALQRHSVAQHVDRLTMPVFVQHGSADGTIPVEQFRQLAATIARRGNFRMEEMPGGDHEAPIRQTAHLAWLLRQVQTNQP